MKNLTLLVILLNILSSQLFSQTNNCNLGNATGQIPVGNSCNYSIWDIPDNGNYWTGFTGCGSNGTNDVWAWFVATSTSTTINYSPFDSFNPVIHAFTGSCSSGMTSIACSNANGNNQVETLVLTTVIGQTYMIRIEPRNVTAGNGEVWGDLCVYNTVPLPPASNITCAQPNPICSGSPITFTANSGGSPASTVNPGNSYGCLSSTPNPSWYYLEIDQAGNLAIDITAGSDVDFRMWGPFANLAAAQAGCNSYTNGQAVDCSFSTAATEQANANGVLAGQVYVLLVTNYANTVQTISINEAGSNTASTNCSIVPLPVGFSFWDAAVVNEEVVLMWETESEHNSSHFLVQRSGDGLIWETIGLVQGNGDSEEAQAYSFRDNDPVLGIGYYRLNQIDMDGKNEFTNILSVNTLKSKTLTVFPNPSHGFFTIQEDPKDVSEIYMTDIIGKVHNPEITDGGNSIIVNTENMAKGIYNITAIVRGEKVVKRIIVQ